MGAPHARLVVRTLLKALCDRVSRIETIEAIDRNENESSYRRRVAYTKLNVRLIKRDQS